MLIRILTSILCMCTMVTGPIASELTPVRLSSFPSFGKDSFFYLAVDASFYRDEGVDFTFKPTFVGALPPVAVGRFEVGQDLCSEIIRAKVQGAPLRIIAARDALFPVGTVSLAASRIRTPTAYAKKRWATAAGANPEIAFMGELGKLAGFDPATITLQNIPFNARIPALLAGQSDFASAWYGSGYPQYASTLRKAGVPFDFVRWSDYGIDAYGQCLAAREDWLSTNADAARRFLRATLRGISAAIAEPSSAVRATIKLNPNANLDADVVAEQWKQAQELLYDAHAREHGLLTISGAKVARMVEVNELGKSINIDRLYTNAYLPTR
jgi:NitT/TauT family transport system substrate-binding protein